MEKYIEKKEKIPDYIEINNFKLFIESGNEKDVLDRNYVYNMENSNDKNLFLAGHNNYKVFSRLYTLKIGDIIKINYKNNLYNYEIYNMKYINVMETEVFKQEDFNKLTLITCTNDNQKRFIVQCKIKE